MRGLPDCAARREYGADERHAGPVDEVRRGTARRGRPRRRGAGGEAADVVAAQRLGAAEGGGRSASSAVIPMSRTASAMQNLIEVV